MRCKCKIAVPGEMDRDKPEWEGARWTPRWQLVFNRCRYHCRRNGCRHGDRCKFCHLHAFRRGEPDYSQVVEDPRTGRVHKLQKRERRQQQENRTVLERIGQFAWRQMAKSAEEDHDHYVNFGYPVDGVHAAVWCIHRLLPDARKTQERVAFVLSQRRGKPWPTAAVGLWLGVDKFSRTPGHYPHGDAHGVHTLMKGLATRLPQLMSDSVGATHFWIFEADAWPSDVVGSMVDQLIATTKEHDFLQLGFFTNERPNHYGRYHWEWYTHEEARTEGLTGGKYSNTWGASYKIPDFWPWTFKGNAQGGLCPAFGCQWFALEKQFAIQIWVPRLLRARRPYGLDMFFLSEQCLSDEENKFLSWSLAGQWPGPSDSFGGINLRAGQVEEPPMDPKRIHVRSYAERELQGKRREMWLEHLKYHKQRAEWEKNPSYRRWLSTGDSSEEDEEPGHRNWTDGETRERAASSSWQGRDRQRSRTPPGRRAAASSVAPPWRQKLPPWAFHRGKPSPPNWPPPLHLQLEDEQSDDS